MSSHCSRASSHRKPCAGHGMHITQARPMTLGGVNDATFWPGVPCFLRGQGRRIPCCAAMHDRRPLRIASAIAPIDAGLLTALESVFTRRTSIVVKREVLAAGAALAGC